MTQGRVILVDDEDFEWLSKFKWHGARYASTGHGREVRYMHRMIMNAQRGQQIDHMDGNCLNNQRSNLRLCTHSQNQANRHIQINNKSGFKGVHWNTSSKKWVARIVINYKPIHLGVFDDPREAHTAYCAKAKELFGVFAGTEIRMDHTSQDVPLTKEV